MANMSEVVQQLMKRAGARAERGSTYRRGTRSAWQHQLERLVSSHYVRSRSAENQPVTEGAMGKEDSQAKANDLSGWPEADRCSAESKVGEGEEGRLNHR